MHHSCFVVVVSCIAYRQGQTPNFRSQIENYQGFCRYGYMHKGMWQTTWQMLCSCLHLTATHEVRESLASDHQLKMCL